MLNDHVFHDFTEYPSHGINWGEIAFCRGIGSLQLLAILISTDMSYGDRQAPSFTGEWMGDRIAMVGDYDDCEWKRISDYEDITHRLVPELLKMPYWKERFPKREES
jgi:hypothetical protein